MYGMTALDPVSISEYIFGCNTRFLLIKSSIPLHSPTVVATCQKDFPMNFEAQTEPPSRKTSESSLLKNVFNKFLASVAFVWARAITRGSQKISPKLETTCTGCL